MGRTVMLALAASGLLAAGLLAVAKPSTAAPRPASSQPVQAGTNLLRNPYATVGDTSAQGWDAVTIPGWQVQAGLPTVVRYGTPGFPEAATWPKNRGDLFVGGDGGPASLVQVVRLGKTRPGTRFTASAWLGGSKTSDAILEIRFLNAQNQVEGSATRHGANKVLAYRSVTGTVPDGATQARVTLILATTLKNYNGPDAPQVGYNYAAAGGLRLTLSRAAPEPAPVTPSHPKVPGYQHVFLFYFENEDVSQIIGNTRQAPYVNSLLSRARRSQTSTRRNTRATPTTSPSRPAPATASRRPTPKRRAPSTRSTPATSVT